MDIQTIQHSSQLQAGQQPQGTMVPESSDGILANTGRSIRVMPNDGNNNSGFYAILEQVRDRSSNSEEVSLLKRDLVCADGKPLDRDYCQKAANHFHHPIVVIEHGTENQVSGLLFCTPSTEADRNQSLFFRHDELSENFVQNCRSGTSVKDIEAQPLVEEEINDLSQYVTGLDEARVFDVALALLQRPETIALVHNEGDNHFDAAPHRDLR
jgi:hypothetical protein